ncbi:DUF397 domain-containing protein [Micromonospora rubida]|uniref:DUF397 domain-containing protein n=1 Tax=Micromonospora rubida TaxID=2697657 RepID=A0ABW7STR7_9ACTN
MSMIMWKKSTRSNGGGNCVEVAMPPQAVMVRDSKDPHGPKLSFTARRWAEFVRGLKAGNIH